MQIKFVKKYKNRKIGEFGDFEEGEELDFLLKTGTVVPFESNVFLKDITSEFRKLKEENILLREELKALKETATEETVETTDKPQKGKK